MERDARFASDVSHELRSPLTTLTTTASVLQQHHDELSPAAQESLDLLTADLSIFRSLVEDLLEIARSDAGATTLVIETVGAVELVRQSVRSAVQRHALVEPLILVEGDLDEVTVSVDRRRFERVVTNLLVNAHQYAATRSRCASPVHDDALVARRRRRRARHPRRRARAGLRAFLPRSSGPRPHHVARDRTGPGAGTRPRTSFHGTISVHESPEGGARFEIVLPVRGEVA